MKPSYPAPSATLKAKFLYSVQLEKKIEYINLQVVKKNQTHPQGPHRLLLQVFVNIRRGLSNQFINQSFDHASYQRIL